MLRGAVTELDPSPGPRLPLVVNPLVELASLPAGEELALRAAPPPLMSCRRSELVVLSSCGDERQLLGEDKGDRFLARLGEMPNSRSVEEATATSHPSKRVLLNEEGFRGIRPTVEIDTLFLFTGVLSSSSFSSSVQVNGRTPSLLAGLAVLGETLVRLTRRLGSFTGVEGHSSMSASASPDAVQHWRGELLSLSAAHSLNQAAHPLPVGLVPAEDPHVGQRQHLGGLLQYVLQVLAIRPEEDLHAALAIRRQDHPAGTHLKGLAQTQFHQHGGVHRNAHESGQRALGPFSRPCMVIDALPP